MNPTTGIADCCARAVSDHATTVLLKSLMNSRRLMGFTPLAENHLRASLIRTWSDGHAPHRSMSSGLMSALGQKQTLGKVRPMSALPPKADIALHCSECPLCAKSGREQPQQNPAYSITSSAPASSDCGTVSPSAFAVLRLMTSSYLVGACTGRSPGFSPLRMRPT